MVQELSGGHRARDLQRARSRTPALVARWHRTADMGAGLGNDGVYVMPQLGGSRAGLRPAIYAACWSPDGSTIAVASYLDGRIWLRDRLGRELRTLSLHGTHWSIGDLDWSPANGLLAFVSNDYQGRFSVWTIRPDGSDQQRVVADSTGDCCRCVGRPHGDALYYSRRLNQTVSIARIHVRARAGSTGKTGGTTLVTGLESDGSFALSAQGRRLVYTRAPYHSNLYARHQQRRPAPDRPPERLTQGTQLIERPRVSPDGRSIVFNVGHEGQPICSSCRSRAAPETADVSRCIQPDWRLVA